MLSVVGLAEEHTYPTGPYPTSIAVAADGRLALGSASPRGADPDLFEYADRGTAPVWSFDFGDRGTAANVLAPRGLAWSADGTRLYAVITDTDGTDVVLHTLVVEP